MKIDLKKCVIKIKDGTPTTPKSVTLKIGDGNLTYTERRNIEYTLDGGNLDEVREGDQVPVDLRLDFNWEYYTASSGGTETFIDALKKTGEASNWVSSDSDACRPYSVDIEITHTPTPSTCGDKEVLLFSDFRYEQIDGDIRGGTFSVTGKCNVVAPTATRTAQV